MADNVSAAIDIVANFFIVLKSLIQILAHIPGRTVTAGAKARFPKLAPCGTAEAMP
jgi:hypothetical protein